MASKKIFILLPDGVGLRNFAFSSFTSVGENYNWDITFWNTTPFDLKKLGLKEISLSPKVRPITDMLKVAKIKAELNYFEKKFNDPVYNSYKFPYRAVSKKAKVKKLIVSGLEKIFSGERGLSFLKYSLNRSERNSKYYKECRERLIEEKPDLIFCTSQRPVIGIAPILAAKDIGIPTCCFIFSWDNLSKATLVLDTDYYFVWSDLMKEEFRKYYPDIEESRIIVTGTPQFESHFDQSLIEYRKDFFTRHNLDESKRYICFSGDDITTSPDDPTYLDDLAKACRKLNNIGFNLGVIFRRCPVDFSDRYEDVLEKHRDIIVAISPAWSNEGNNWGTVLPLQTDQALLLNTIYHSEATVNLGSTMVFDSALLTKPCFYINYNVDNPIDIEWNVEKIYRYIHFRSMPKNTPVIWLNSPEEIAEKLQQISTNQQIVQNALEWFHTINKHPANEASDRIWKSINKIHS